MKKKPLSKKTSSPEAGLLYYVREVRYDKFGTAKYGIYVNCSGQPDGSGGTQFFKILPDESSANQQAIMQLLSVALATKCPVQFEAWCPKQTEWAKTVTLVYPVWQAQVEVEC